MPSLLAKSVSLFSLHFLKEDMRKTHPDRRRFASVGDIDDISESFYCFHDSAAEEAAVFPEFRTFNNLKALQVQHESGRAMVGFLARR